MYSIPEILGESEWGLGILANSGSWVAVVRKQEARMKS